MAKKAAPASKAKIKKAPVKSATKTKAKVEDEKQPKKMAPKAAPEPVQAAKIKKLASPPKEPKISAAKSKEILANSDNLKRWQDFNAALAAVKAPNYIMTGQFPTESGLQHKTLGWGYILTNNNDRLEVLFESGIKILISNYRPPA